MTVATNLKRLREEVGEFVARHERAQGAETFSRYRDDPCGFLTDVLHVKHLWGRQREIAELVRDHRQVVVRSANSVGKDFLGARLAVWWAVARGGLALLTGPTDRQVRSVLMKELARAFRSNRDLPGELFTMALRIGDEDKVLAFTASDPDRFTGFHDPETLVIVTEGQGVADDIYEAAQACTTSEGSRLLVLGNPLRPVGTFYSICRSPNWVSVKIPASEHPNVIAGREIIRGAVTRRWVDNIASEYGRDSSQYLARVEAEFPQDAIEQLVRSEWIDRAFEAYRTHKFNLQEGRAPTRLVLDVAAGGGDRNVLGIVKGPVIQSLECWYEPDTMQTVRRVAQTARRLWVEEPRGPRAPIASRTGREAVRVTLDEIGVGTGVRDRLREMDIPVEAFNSARQADKPAIYKNRRAECYWTLRERLERGTFALPPDDELREELLATTWSLTGSGQILIESKDEIRRVLKRSPDKADTVMMACVPSRMAATFTYRM